MRSTSATTYRVGARERHLDETDGVATTDGLQGLAATTGDAALGHESVTVLAAQLGATEVTESKHGSPSVRDLDVGQSSA